MSDDTSPAAATRYERLPTHVQVELKRIAQQSTVRVVDILRKTHEPHVVRARVQFMRYLRNKGYSFPAIGRVLLCNHSTVIHHLKPLPPKEPPPFPDESGIWAI